MAPLVPHPDAVELIVTGIGLDEELRIHDLRSTSASMQISSGANVKVVQKALGHASAAVTLNIYAGLFEADLDTTADALDKRFLLTNVAPVLPGAVADVRELHAKAL